MLYNWPAAIAGETSSSSNPSGIKGISPTGWHLPSDAEWKQLEMDLGMTTPQVDETNSWRGNDQGSQLKNTSGWYNNGNGTNTSGFSALPAGQLNGNGEFWEIGQGCHFQTSTQISSIDSWRRSLSFDKQSVNRYYTWKKCGYSVRCVKD